MLYKIWLILVIITFFSMSVLAILDFIFDIDTYDWCNGLFILLMIFMSLPIFEVMIKTIF